MTDSSMSPTISPQPDLTEAEQALKEELQLSAGTSRLGRMVGLHSLKRTLKLEDKQTAQDIDTQQRVLWGEDGQAIADSNAEGDDMGDILSARDVIININRGTSTTQNPAPAAKPPEPLPQQAQQAQQPIQPQASGPVPSQPRGIPSWLRTAMLLAGVGAAGAAGAVAVNALTDDRPQVVDTDTDTRSDFELSQE